MIHRIEEVYLSSNIPRAFRDAHAGARLISPHGGPVFRRFKNMPCNVQYYNERYDSYAGVTLVRSGEEPLSFNSVVCPAGYPTLMPECRVHNFAYALLRHAAIKLPHLAFYVDLKQPGIFTSGLFKSVYIFEQSECVGHIEGSDTVSGALLFFNERITASLRRGQKMKTANKNKAFAIIRKYFYGLTGLEKLQSSAHVLKTAVASAWSKTTSSYALTKSNVLAELTEELFSNAHLRHAAEQVLKAKGKLHLLEQFSSISEDHRLVSGVHNSQEQDRGMYVKKVGDQYCVWSPKNDKVRSYARDSLPVKVRGAVGMLKLAQDCSFIEDVGYKYDAEQFWLSEDIANELSN